MIRLDPRRAAAALAAGRREFLARDMAYDAALVTLELATLSIEEGRTAEVKNAALLETATTELAREVAASLARARSAPAGQDRD